MGWPPSGRRLVRCHPAVALLLSVAVLGTGCVVDRRAACRFHSDCDDGYCAQTGFCRRECVEDEDCPCGSYCAAGCGICIRDDNAGPATCIPLDDGLTTDAEVTGACRLRSPSRDAAAPDGGPATDAAGAGSDGGSDAGAADSGDPPGDGGEPDGGETADSGAGDSGVFRREPGRGGRSRSGAPHLRGSPRGAPPLRSGRRPEAGRGRGGDGHGRRPGRRHRDAPGRTPGAATVGLGTRLHRRTAGWRTRGRPTPPPRTAGESGPGDVDAGVGDGGSGDASSPDSGGSP